MIFSEVVSPFYDYQNFKSVCIQFSVIQFWTSLSTKLCKQNELRNFNDLSRISLMKMKPIYALERILLKYTKTRWTFFKVKLVFECEFKIS